MGFLATNIERIWGGGGILTFKSKVRNKFTERETVGGMASGTVYIISGAKGKGGVEM